jgi:acylphosphatase
MKNLRIVVIGRVQGVNFRNNTKEFCDSLGIFGSVMNQDDGSVLIMAQGEAGDLDELLKWLKTSPGFSKVENVTASEVRMNERFYEFNVIRESNVFRDKGKAFRHFAKRMFGKGKT